jgi:flagellar hook-length control protein FliK
LTPSAAGESDAALFARVLTQQLQAPSMLGAAGAQNPGGASPVPAGLGGAGNSAAAAGAGVPLPAGPIAGIPAGSGNPLPIEAGKTNSSQTAGVFPNADSAGANGLTLGLQRSERTGSGADRAVADERSAQTADAAQAELLGQTLAQAGDGSKSVPAIASSDGSRLEFPQQTLAKPTAPASASEESPSILAGDAGSALIGAMLETDKSGPDDSGADEKNSADAGLATNQAISGIGSDAAAAQNLLAAWTAATRPDAPSEAATDVSFDSGGRSARAISAGGASLEGNVKSAAPRLSLANWAANGDDADSAAPLSANGERRAASSDAAIAQAVPSPAASAEIKPSPAFQAALQQAQAPVAAPKENAPPLDKPVGQPGWSQDLGERVTWMTQRGAQTAEIRLNPPHLGPLEVRVDINREQQASIQFVAHHAVVREALEAAMPRLREMMEAQHVNLGEVSVSQHSFADRDNAQTGFEQQNRQGRGFQGESADIPSASYPEAESIAPNRIGNGLLSLYA